MMFEVEVQVEAGYEDSGRIQQVDWETLTVTYDDEGEPLDEGCTEEQIKEGTCGYAPDGDIDPYSTDELEPAGAHLFILEDEEELNESPNPFREHCCKFKWCCNLLGTGMEVQDDPKLLAFYNQWLRSRKNKTHSSLKERFQKLANIKNDKTN